MTGLDHTDDSSKLHCVLIYRMHNSVIFSAK